MADKFENSGVRIVGERPPSLEYSQRTIVVLGVGRGGTSAVAGVLSHLGVFMGQHAYRPTFEDHAIYRPMEAGDTKACQAVIDKYSAKHPVWGFKRGSISEFVQDYHGRFVNPIYLVVFRDLAAIANRAEISGGDEYLEMLEYQQQQYARIVEFLCRVQPYALVLSYEKMLARPELLVQSVIDFCGLQSSPVQLDRAISFIEPSPSDYLRGTRVERAEGALTYCAGHSVRGWARYAHRGDPPVVELFINGELTGETVANRRLKGTRRKQSNSQTAFAFRAWHMRPGDQVRVKVKGEEFDLEYSPYYVQSKKPQRAVGHLDTCEGGLIRGWAKYVDNDEFPVVDIYRNGELVAQCTADLTRAHLQVVRADGRCAFEQRIDGLQAGDLIRARVRGEGTDLHNSPYACS